VRGRTIILIVSIKIRNGFNHIGAPSGKKWAVNLFQLLNILEITIFNHIGKPINRVKIKWLDKERVYGFKPIKLIMITIKNIVDKDVINPFKKNADVRITCWVIIIKVNDKNIIIRLYEDQNIIIIDIIIGIDRKIVMWVWRLENDKGSNEEKISGIIAKYGGTN